MIQSSPTDLPAGMSRSTVTKLAAGLLGLALFGLTFHLIRFPSYSQRLSANQSTSDQEPVDQEEDSLRALGQVKNSQVSESSGLARCSSIDDAIWTLNDSGHSAKLFLLKNDGSSLAEVTVPKSKNRDWESLSRFTHNNRNFLLIADVGDNLKRRKVYDLYWLQEPDLSKNVAPGKVVKQSALSTKLQFEYPDGPKNCEAVAVNQAAKEVWFIEKVYYESKQKEPPGIYVIPLELTPTAKPHVARRIESFPIRNVTGMAFSPDGKRLIIRNYITAHMYSRQEGESWEHVVQKFKPTEVALPLQRQGEAVCFTKDSQSIIVTSELRRQQIWQVNLKQYLDKPRAEKKSKSNRKPNDK